MKSNYTKLEKGYFNDAQSHFSDWTANFGNDVGIGLIDYKVERKGDETVEVNGERFYITKPKLHKFLEKYPYWYPIRAFVDKFGQEHPARLAIIPRSQWTKIESEPVLSEDEKLKQFSMNSL